MVPGRRGRDPGPGGGWGTWSYLVTGTGARLAARAFASAALADWGISDRAYEVTLCVSELVTNALLYGVPPGRGFRLGLSLSGDVLRVEVHDSGAGWPRLAGEGEDTDESGRGLLLVAALAGKWGVMERDPGKIVWCEFAQESSSTSARVDDSSRTSR